MNMVENNVLSTILDRHKKCWDCRKIFDNDWLLLIYNHFHKHHCLNPPPLPEEMARIICEECSKKPIIDGSAITKVPFKCGFCDKNWEDLYKPLSSHSPGYLGFCFRPECVKKYSKFNTEINDAYAKWINDVKKT